MTVMLFTGVPKAGKTLFAVTKLLDILKEDAKRPIFCDIKGLNIAGVQPAPDDWSTCPDGSLIIYDEVQYRLPYKRARGATKFDFILDLTTHAHRGIDVWLITQSPKFLHSDVTEVVGEHYHLTRPNNVKFSKYMKWSACEGSPNGTTAKRECDAKGIVRHNPDVFALYNAVQVDDDIANHKKWDITMANKIYIVIGLLLFLFISYRVYGRMTGDNDLVPARPATVAPLVAADTGIDNPMLDNNNVEGGKELDVIEPESLPPEPLAPEPAPQFDTRVAGHIAFGDKCKAYNAKNEVIPMSHKDCMAL